MSKRKRIKLSKDSRLNKTMIEELDLMFAFNTPTEIKNTVTELLIEYNLTLQDGLPIRHQGNIGVIYQLFHFLTACEEELQKPNDRNL